MPTRGCRFEEPSLFLCEHRALSLFQDQVNTQNRGLAICERNEDLQALHAQLQISTPLPGVLLCSMDSLAQEMGILLGSVHEPLQKPYLSIDSQERLVELCLYSFGYQQRDSTVLARQILRLLDVPLPPDTSLAAVLLNAQSGSDERRTKIDWRHIPQGDLVIRQILATIQHSQIELASYLRFQELCLSDLANDLWTHRHLSHATSQPQKSARLTALLAGCPVLWLGAPTYATTPQDGGPVLPPFRPGNFTSELGDGFLAHIRTLCALVGNNLLETRASLTLAPAQTTTARVGIRVFLHDSQFSQEAHNLLHSGACVLLGDWEPDSLTPIRQDGGGLYAVTQEDLDFWEHTDAPAPENEEDTPGAERRQQMDTIFTQLQATRALIQHEPVRLQIASQYNLPTQTWESIHTQKMRISPLRWGFQTAFETQSKALSYLAPHHKRPEQIVCLGAPHKPVTTSLSVRLLNAVFYHLNHHGVAVESPHFEAVYRIFWDYIAHQDPPVVFWLPDKASTERLPAAWSHTALDIVQPPTQALSCPGSQALVPRHVPHWQQIAPDKDRFGTQGLPVTAFEEYIHCPHAFFLKFILKLEPGTDAGAAAAKEVGIKAHTVCEQFLTRINMLFGNSASQTEKTRCWQALLQVLGEEETFLSFEQASWQEAFSRTLAQYQVPQAEALLHACTEAIQTIWSPPIQPPAIPSFGALQQQELLKRTFLRFVRNEWQTCQDTTKARAVGVLREWPVSFALGGLQLAGRIDRLDRSDQGWLLIDYKTGKPHTGTACITLWPQEAQKNKNARLSAQGALYAYGAVCGGLTDADGAHEDLYQDHQLAAYELYYLKNVNPLVSPVVTIPFDPPLNAHSPSWQRIQEAYTPYARSLLEGNFSPNPLQGEKTCGWCNFQSVCPWLAAPTREASS